MIFKVGEVIPQFIGHQEIPLFDMDDSGAILEVFFDRPTDQEISQFQSGVNFEFRFLEINGMIEILVKFGSLAWIDASYTPHLSPRLTNYNEFIPESAGYLLTVALIDGVTGTVKALRIIGLNHNVSVKLQESIKKLAAESFDINRHFSNVRLIQQRYSTKELVRMSKFYHKE